MKQLKLFMMLMLCMIGMASCSSEDGPSIDTTPFDLKVALTIPDGYKDVTFSDIAVKLTDVNTQKETTVSGQTDEHAVVTLNNIPGGYYKIELTGKMNYKNDDLVTKTVDFVAYSDGITLTKEFSTAALNIQITS